MLQLRAPVFRRATYQALAAQDLLLLRDTPHHIGSHRPVICFARRKSEVAENASATGLQNDTATVANLPETVMQSQIAELSRKVDHLTVLLEKQSSGNLLEAQARKAGVAEKTLFRPSRDGKSCSRKEFRPTLDMVANQVNHASQLSNETLATTAIAGDAFAQRERLIREIMYVDDCTWDAAHDQLIKMDLFNEEHYWLHTMPYRCGIAVATLACVSSICLVFWKPVAQRYGERIAGEELPEGVADISTMTTNQVGSWTWTWMEPMIGTASFVLLCLQFARAQSVKLNMHPYTESMLRWRASRVATQYPSYDASMVRVWAKQMPRVDWKFMPKFRRRRYTPEMRTQNFRGAE